MNNEKSDCDESKQDQCTKNFKDLSENFFELIDSQKDKFAINDCMKIFLLNIFLILMKLEKSNKEIAKLVSESIELAKALLKCATEESEGNI